MRSTALPVSCVEDVAVDFLSHLPSFEFYGFQSLERGQLAIKTIYIYIYMLLTGWGTDRPWRCCEEVCQSSTSHAHF